MCQLKSALALSIWMFNNLCGTLYYWKSINHSHQVGDARSCSHGLAQLQGGQAPRQYLATELEEVLPGVPGAVQSIQTSNSTPGIHHAHPIEAIMWAMAVAEA